MRIHFLAITGLSAAMFLSACQSGNFGNRSNAIATSLTPQAGAELNGTWLPTDQAARGVYEAEFKDGIFVSRSPTTNKPLAKGNYKIVSDKVIDLDEVSSVDITGVFAFRLFAPFCHVGAVDNFGALSGTADHVSISNDVAYTGDPIFFFSGVLPKPYQPKQLLDLVRGVLEGG